MKRKEKIVILVLLVITIVLVVVGFNVKINNGKTIAKADKSQTSDDENKVQELDVENVVRLEDGTRYNTSDALKKAKESDGFKLSDIQLTEKENQTLVLGTLTNTSGKKQDACWLDVILVDKDGNELSKMPTYVAELESGASTRLETSTSLDFVHAYDLKIVKE